MSGNDIDIDAFEKNLVEIVNGACEMLRKQK